MLSLILALSIAPLTLAVYNPLDSIDYLTASALSSETPSSILSWTCGAACRNLTGYHPYFSHVFNISVNESLAFSMIYQPCTKKFITAFRGTSALSQLQLEIQDSDPVSYELADIPGAQAVGYFYTRYSQFLRETLLKKIQQAHKNFPRFQFIFTGHSLGGALTTLAAFDVVSSGYLPARKVRVYNYGSPRVGNQALAQAIAKAIPDFYRVVHWEDIVPHLPPCVTDPAGQCVPHNMTDSKRWPVWHTGHEVFYNEDNTNYTLCKKEEDPKCSDQFSLNVTTWKDHFFYMGRIVSVSGNATLDLSIVQQLDTLTKQVLGL